MTPAAITVFTFAVFGLYNRRSYMIFPELLKFDIKLGIYWFSFLAFPFIVWQLWRLRQRWRRRSLISPIFWLSVSLLFVWARFIEPQWLLTRETTITGTGIQADVALISDIHLGVYKGNGILMRVVERINALPVQYVFIAGDFSYEPDPGELDALFAPLYELKAPVYAVLGNHDQRSRGMDIGQPLRDALRRVKVNLIEGSALEMGTQGSGGKWRLAGLADHWSGMDDPGFIEQESVTLPTLWLVHNPDSVMRFWPGYANLTLSGHTHCGQIRIPWLYRKVIPSRYGFDCGLETANTPLGDVRVFISPGLGEIGLPLRLFNPPSVDWLHLRP
jgi:predicted MPP superfamily phosphohydrolase